MDTAPRIRVAVLLMDEMWSHDVANVIQVFGVPVDECGVDPCELTLVSAGEYVTFDHGVFAKTVPFSDYETVPDLLLIPGFSYPHGVSRILDSAGYDDWEVYSGWLCSMYGRGAEVGALGSGPFVLARAGLLSGVNLTAHWRYADQITTLCPGARVKIERMLVYDAEHRIWTCAGGISGLDLCQNMLVHVAGAARARAVTANANLRTPRSLETRQESLMRHEGTVEDVGPDRDLIALADTVRCSLEQPWSVIDMARAAGMSVRTFQRRFQRVIGQAPSRWLLSERLIAACELLESTDETIDSVASRVGLGGAEILRRHFVAAYGMTPAAYRRNYS